MSILRSGVDIDFYLVYFLAILITSIQQNIKVTVFTALLTSCIYMFLITKTQTNVDLLSANFLIKIPFFFIVALFTGFLSQETRKERKEKEEAQILLRLSSLIYSTLNLEKVFDLIVQTAVKLTGLKHSSLLAYEEDREELVLRAICSPEKKALEKSSLPLAEIRPEVVDTLFKQKEPLYIPNVKKYPDLGNFPFWQSCRSFLFFPLVSPMFKGEVIGLLNFASKEPAAFDPENLEKLKVLVPPIVTALENARVYNQIDRFNKQLQQEVALATKELAEANERMSYLIEYNDNILKSLTSGVIVTDLEGTVTTFNREAEKLTNLKTEDILGKSLSSFESLREVDCLLKSTLANLKNYAREEITILSTKGEEVPVSISTSLLSNKENRVLGA